MRNRNANKMPSFYARKSHRLWNFCSAMTAFSIQNHRPDSDSKMVSAVMGDLLALTFDLEALKFPGLKQQSYFFSPFSYTTRNISEAQRTLSRLETRPRLSRRSIDCEQILCSTLNVKYHRVASVLDPYGHKKLFATLNRSSLGP